MSDHLTRYLKIACLVLACLLALQVWRLLGSADPLVGADSLSVTDWSGSSASTQTDSLSQATPTSSRLPPEIQARVDSVVKSEVFGAIPRPLPMALLGIGGQDAFIRTPQGQSQVMRVGEEAGGVTLLRIGTNRVTVQHEGEEKELIMYPNLPGN